LVHYFIERDLIDVVGGWILKQVE